MRKRGAKGQFIKDTDCADYMAKLTQSLKEPSAFVSKAEFEQMRTERDLACAARNRAIISRDLWRDRVEDMCDAPSVSVFLLPLAFGLGLLAGILL